MNNLSTLELYMQDIATFPLLTPKEERSLSRIILGHKNDAEKQRAKKKLVESNLRLVVKWALDYYKRFGSIRKSISLMDLIAEGNIALIRSAETFNGKKGAFSTYASILIRLTIKKAADNSRFISIPHQHLSYWKNIKKITDEYRYELPEDIMAKKLHISKEFATRLRQGLKNTCVMLEDTKNWQDRICIDESHKDVERKLNIEQLRQYLFTKMDKVLTPRENLVCKMLTEYPTNNFTTLAQRLKISSERARQIYIVALRKLKISIINEWQKENGMSKSLKYRYRLSQNPFSCKNIKEISNQCDLEQKKRKEIERKILRELLGEL